LVARSTGGMSHAGRNSGGNQQQREKSFAHAMNRMDYRTESWLLGRVRKGPLSSWLCYGQRDVAELLVLFPTRLNGGLTGSQNPHPVALSAGQGWGTLFSTA
jgi:hypothetical protein